jgi:host factor-I protein
MSAGAYKVVMSMQKMAIALQDYFLNQVRREKVQVTIHLINGYQIKGSVFGFDNFTVIMEVEGRQMVVYKHAISTITPQKPIHFKIPQNEELKEE